MRKQQVWFCLKCNTCGVVSYLSEEGVYTTIEGIRSQHDFNSRMSVRGISCQFEPRVLNMSMFGILELDQL